MNLRWISVMIPSLLLFWMPFDVYKLMYKFWGRIWAQVNQNWVFCENLEWVPERNQNSEFDVCCQTRCSKWSLAIASCSMQQLIILAFWVLRGRSGPSKLILLMYLFVFKLSKPLETSIELDWTWFCELYHNFFKNVPVHEIFRKLVFSRKKGGIRVVYYNHDF